jgi:hypothetical protein
MGEINFWRRLMRPLRRDRSAEAGLAPFAGGSDLSNVLASCEYELRQMSRDVKELHLVASAPARSAQPFVIDGRQRQRQRTNVA